MIGNHLQVIIILFAWLRCISPVTAEDILIPVVRNVAASQLVEVLEKRNSLEKRDCLVGYFSCSNGYCAPDGATCCANDRYANIGWFCCPDGSGRSAPDGATCCPNSLYYARIGEYCCSNGEGSCPNGKTCAGCSGGAVATPAPIVPTASLPAVPTITSPPTTEVLYRYYYYTITYYYISWYYYYDVVIQSSTTTSSEVTTSTEISVYASAASAADSSQAALSATISFYTPAAATLLLPVNTSSPTTTTHSAATATFTSIGSSTSAVSQAVERAPSVAFVHWIVTSLALVLVGGLIL